MKEDNILTVNNLSLLLKKSGRNFKLLDNINFSVPKNKIIGIVGETGSGKTLLMLSIMKMLSSDIKIQSGDIIFMNQNLVDKSDKEIKEIRNKDLVMIFQNQKLSLSPVYKISTQMKDIIKAHKKLNKKELESYCFSLLKQVGFKDPEFVLEKYPFEISGGMFQRVMLAIAMSIEPKLLIADEPTAALDPEAQEYILLIIKKFQEKLKNSFIIVTHDFSVIKKICTDVIVIKNGKIIEQNTTRDILNNPKSEYTKKLIELSKYYV
ncbi:MAG: ABC transporter ATP-binding protein [Oscillospiraceae bacterium]|nr:ABC transporter ATP-binding protein [Oscillospiraceae bacterium]